MKEALDKKVPIELQLSVRMFKNFLKRESTIKKLHVKSAERHSKQAKTILFCCERKK
jgi:hypothetical protein